MGVPASEALALTVLDRTISYLLSTIIGAICLFALGGKHLWRKALTVFSIQSILLDVILRLPHCFCQKDFLKL